MPLIGGVLLRMLLGASKPTVTEGKRHDPTLASERPLSMSRAVSGAGLSRRVETLGGDMREQEICDELLARLPDVE